MRVQIQSATSENFIAKKFVIPLWAKARFVTASGSFLLILVSLESKELSGV